MPLPNQQKQNDCYYKITGARLNLSLRSYHPNKELFTNMIPYISNDINNNFYLKHKHCWSFNLQSVQNQSTEEANNWIDVLQLYSRESSNSLLSTVRALLLQMHLLQLKITIWNNSNDALSSMHFIIHCIFQSLYIMLLVMCIHWSKIWIHSNQPIFTK